MELKCGKAYIITVDTTSFNRTFMELKLPHKTANYVNDKF